MIADTDTLQELSQLRHVVRQHPRLYEQFCKRQCVDALRRTVIFSELEDRHLEFLADHARRVEFQDGDTLVRECDEPEFALVIAAGEIRRWAMVGGRKHHVITFDTNSIGMLHLYNKHPARFNAECVTPVVAYEVRREAIDSLLADPDASRLIITSLSEHVRQSSFSYATPLLEHEAAPGFSFTSTSLAASVDAFYRSFMNCLINQRLTGTTGAYFPNMHIQVPARIAYINGIKMVRAGLQEYFPAPSQFHFPTLAAMFISFLPGVIMSPFASILEATNANMNPEPLQRRWIRGFAPRLAREIIFGVGINQLSDHCTERWHMVGNTHLRGSVGSVSAGLIAGYFSHIPHNLSTMKLQEPGKAYGELWQKLWERYIPYVPQAFARGSAEQRLMAQTMCVLFPIGVVRRSIQIAGTFMLVNGTTFVLRGYSLP